MSAEWAWYHSDDVTPNASASFTPTNGTPTAAVERHLYNDYDSLLGATDSEDFLITGISRPAGSGEYTDSDALAAGGYIEIRLIGSGGTGIVDQTTGWVRVGRGRYLRVKGIPVGCHRQFEMRANVPLGVGVLAKDYKLRLIEDMRAIALESGHTEGGAQGLRLGLGDTSFTSILEGFEMVEAGTPDNTVELGVGQLVYAGVPVVNVPETLTFDDLDYNAVALSSGEEYLALICVDGGGASQTIKSALGTAPLNESFIPATPDGWEAIGWVQVPFSAVITNAEIHQDNLVYGGAKFTGTSTSGEIGPFEALIGNALIVTPGKTPVTLTDDDTNFIWASPSGSVAVELDGAPPEVMSQLLCEVTVASGVVTEVRDCRSWLYPNPVEVHLYRQGTLAGAQVAYGVLPTKASAYLLPGCCGGVVAAVGNGGAVSGSTDFDVSATNRDNTYVTIYTGGTDFPSIAYNAAEWVDLDSIPKLLLHKGGTRFKLDIDAVPGTASVDGIVTLRFSAVGAA